MKAERISEHIWSLRTWMIVPIHVWVVVDKEGVTLVDAGMPMMAKKIIKFTKQLNAGPLKRILLTHGHVDHVGAVKAIVTETEAPVYAHRIEIPYLEGELLYPKRKKAENNLPKQLTKPLIEDEFGNILSVDGLTPYLTPGHSPGHVVYYHEKDKVLLAGDLFNSKKGKLRHPMFTPFMDDAVRSSAIVGKLKPTRLEVCHGNSVFHPVEQLEEYVRKHREKVRGNLIVLIVQYTVFGLFFLMELCTLAAFSYWGFHMDSGLLIKLLFGLGTPLLIADVLGDIHCPKSRFSCIHLVTNYFTVDSFCISYCSAIFFGKEQACGYIWSSCIG